MPPELPQPTNLPSPLASNKPSFDIRLPRLRPCVIWNSLPSPPSIAIQRSNDDVEELCGSLEALLNEKVHRCPD